MGVVEQQVVKAPRQTGLGASQVQRGHDQVAVVARARLGQHPLVGAVDLPELPLELRIGGVIVERLRPRRVGVGPDELGLEPVDPAHEAAEQGVGAPAEVVVAQGQLVDALDQHGQPVTGGEHRLERIGARAGGAQHDPREPSRGEDVELVIASAQLGLDPRAQCRRARLGGDEQPDALRGTSLRHQPAKACFHDARLACPGRAEDDDTGVGMGRRVALDGGQSVKRAVGSDAVGEQVQALEGAAACVLLTHRLTA